MAEIYRHQVGRNQIDVDQIIKKIVFNQKRDKKLKDLFKNSEVKNIDA